MNQGKILAVDDEKNIRHLISNEFSLEGFDVVTAATGEEGLALFKGGEFDVVLLDIMLPKLSGIEILKRMKRISPATEIIMVTGYGDIRSSVEAIKLGARDYVTKPFKLDELLKLVRHSIQEKPPTSNAVEKTGDFQAANSGQIIQCPSQAMKKIYDLVDRVASSNYTVLICGETGVGKDVLASWIHSQSLRKNGPFISLDCGLLSQNLAESELYGHRKGAFSGASEAKIGMVEKSHKGTLFLDEIGNIDLEVQKKFLRFIETKQIRRVGETREKHVDARIILATNLDLEKAMGQGILRSDLFFRMAEITVTIPPLKDRPEDIMPLAQHFLSQFSVSKAIAPEVDDILLAYPWPGNVRELKAMIGKVSLMADNNTITIDDIPRQLNNRISASPDKPRTLEDMEKEHILTILAETGGNQTQAAEILNINRKTLYKKINKYKIFS
jgi:two-component system NtrC family response regulator